MKIILIGLMCLVFVQNLSAEVPACRALFQDIEKLSPREQILARLSESSFGNERYWESKINLALKTLKVLPSDEAAVLKGLIENLSAGYAGEGRHAELNRVIYGLAEEQPISLVRHIRHPFEHKVDHAVLKKELEWLILELNNMKSFRVAMPMFEEVYKNKVRQWLQDLDSNEEFAKLISEQNSDQSLKVGDNFQGIFQIYRDLYLVSADPSFNFELKQRLSHHAELYRQLQAERELISESEKPKNKSLDEESAAALALRADAKQLIPFLAQLLSPQQVNRLELKSSHHVVQLNPYGTNLKLAGKTYPQWHNTDLVLSDQLWTQIQTLKVYLMKYISQL